MTELILIISLIFQYLSVPQEYVFPHEVKFVERHSYEDFDAEVMLQRNGPDTWQRVVMVIPRDAADGPCPAVVVPFYFPDAMLGFDILTGEALPRYAGIEMMAHLAKRGFICISAESYHLTYCPDSGKPRDDFSRWQDAADALLTDWPQWCGIGKLVADTRLLIDILESDPRVDNDRIGIAGHSLGGKMAFYTGCVDPRIKAILASDFGLLWEQTNWEKPWYWGDRLEELKAAGACNTDLWEYSGFKPFFLIAGEADNDDSRKALSAAMPRDCKTLFFLNHATGHRPPGYALEKGYDFLEKYLK